MLKNRAILKNQHLAEWLSIVLTARHPDFNKIISQKETIFPTLVVNIILYLSDNIAF